MKGKSENPAMKNRGLLIVFEGLDRSGKSTQARKLIDTLQSKGHAAKFMRFPERKTVIGQAIGDYLQKKKEMDDHAAHLMFSANRWEFYDEMKKDLLNGTTLVIDRYAYSGVAYTSAKGYSIDWCKGPDRGLLAPDVVFYLEIPLKTASSRGGYGDERYETKSFQEKVFEKYQQLKDDSWKMIDADRNIDEIHKEITNITMKLKDQKLNPSFRSLWTEKEPAIKTEVLGELELDEFGRKRRSMNSTESPACKKQKQTSPCKIN
eukprot:Seg122.8 transcript_id=Seg122.8/GoldUCD/mRNA.D3Y31 product="Thymidylate kinase" protein_id=Seg122.8/GoldUCD/D3Y31